MKNEEGVSPASEWGDLGWSQNELLDCRLDVGGDLPVAYVWWGGE